MTLVVWGGAIGMVSAIAPFVAEGDMPLVAGVGLFVALLATFLFWGLPEVTRMYNARLAARVDEMPAATKSRRQRGDKLALLLELMDDDEREAFKEALKRRTLDNIGYDDGELPYSSETLASLLEDQESQDRLRK
jgi:hypothetical protein